MTWKTKKLGEIGTIFNGNSINERIKKEKYTNLDNGFPFIATKDVNFETHQIDYENGVKIPFDEKKFKIAHKNSVLICVEGGSAGKKTAYNSKDICFGNKLFAIETKDKIDPKFVYYWYLTPYFLESFKHQMHGIIGGVSMNNFKNIQIPIPSFHDQLHIVKILDEAFEKIEKVKQNTEKSIQNSKDIFKSYLQDTFEDSENKWTKRKIYEICNYDKTPHKGNSLPYIGLEDIESNSGKFIGSLTPKKVKSNTFHFTNEHVLYGRLRPYLNKVLTPSFEGHCSTEIFPIKPNKNLNRTFLFYWLISEKIVKKINATWTGARMPRANMNLVLNFDIPVPSVIEQKLIISKLNKLSEETKRIESIYKQKLADLEELKKSILVKAFNGDL